MVASLLSIASHHKEKSLNLDNQAVFFLLIQRAPFIDDMNTFNYIHDGKRAHRTSYALDT